MATYLKTWQKRALALLIGVIGLGLRLVAAALLRGRRQVESSSPQKMNL